MTQSPDPRLLDARRLHQAGRLAEAESLYLAVLAADGRNLDALRLYAVLCRQTGRTGEAARRLGQAAALAPGLAEVQAELADALMADRRPGDAAQAFAAAIKADPGLAEAHAGLGVALAMDGRLEAAADAFRQATALRPADVGAWSNLGKALEGLGRLDEAAEALTRAVALRPDFPAAQFNLAVVLEKLGRPEEAEVPCRKALALKPDWPEAHAQLAHLMLEVWRLEEAEAAARTALRLNPRLANAGNTLGVALFHQGRLQEAEAALRQAIALDPSSPKPRHSLAFALLKQGRLEEGFREYEQRLRLERAARAPGLSQAPRWEGQPLAGKTLLVESEQGAGDNIQFVRFAAEVAGQGARVVLFTSPGLAPLLATAPGVAEAVSAPVPADYRCSIISLPAYLGTRIETIPAKVPYLRAEPERVARWAERLGEGGFKVGLAWQGSRLNKFDRMRSIPLKAFAPLAEVPGVRLISIQKVGGLEQLDDPSFAVERLGPDYEASDWSDTAALIETLDLVIACDTASAHVAGALGRPVWSAQPFVSEWRWFTGRADSPWYPTIRLFRQPEPGDWDGVFRAMAEALKAR